MSKALEAAVKAGTVCGLAVYNEKGDDHPFDAEDARAIITAFLDAAAGDDAVLMAAQNKGEQLAGDRVPGALRMAMGDIATKGAQAAILALKESVNG